MRCPRCGGYSKMARECKICFYNPKIEWWKWVLLWVVFGGLVLGGYYEVL